MKLLNMLVVGTISTLAAVGCSSTTTTTTDGGATGADTGTTPVDTGTTPVDTGTTPVDSGESKACENCLKANCSAQAAACGAEAKCIERLKCMEACEGKPGVTECRNACISSIASPAGDTYIECIQAKCKTECPL